MNSASDLSLGELPSSWRRDVGQLVNGRIDLWTRLVHLRAAEVNMQMVDTLERRKFALLG